MRPNLAFATSINPQALTGRDGYQLLYVAWLDDITNPTHVSRPGERFAMWLEAMTSTAKAPERVRGLAALVMLGEPWENVDTLDALAHAIRSPGGRQVSALVLQRELELIRQGKRSALAGGSANPTISAQMAEGWSPSWSVAGNFRRLRREADAWQARRAAFMEARQRAGHHPDTDPAFWSGYTDSGPTVRQKPFALRLADRFGPDGPLVFLTPALLFLLAAAILSLWGRWRKWEWRPDWASVGAVAFLILLASMAIFPIFAKAC